MEAQDYLKTLSDQELNQLVDELQNNTQFDEESLVRKTVLAIYGEINIMALQVNQLAWPLAVELSRRLSECDLEVKPISKDQDRVKVVYNKIVHVGYQIIEVDGIEYIANLSGGITPLIKPSSKNGSKNSGTLYS
jgi:hypothetical protein